MGLVDELQISLVGIKKGRALDIGTRFGEFALRLVKVMPQGSEIIGIDSEQSVIDQAKEKAADRGVKFECMSGESLSYEDNSFELVALSNTMHHIKDYKKVLEEMYRVLCPGGFFVLNEMYCDVTEPAQKVHVMQHTFEAKLDMRKGIYQRKTWTRKELLDIMSGMDLKDVRVSDYTEDVEFDKKLKAKNEKLVERADRETSGMADHDKMVNEAEMIQKLCNRDNIQRCTEMLYVGRK